MGAQCAHDHHLERSDRRRRVVSAIVRNTPSWIFGTIGFSYPDWNGLFFPPGCPAERRLAAYAQVFSGIELDTTFYAAPKPEAVLRWKDQVPAAFQFSLKAPKAVTHDFGGVGDPREATAAWAEFVANIELLGAERTIALIQLGPSFTADRFPNLLSVLDAQPAHCRMAFEFRHRSLFTDSVYELLRVRGAVVVAADLAPNGCARLPLLQPDPISGYTPFEPIDLGDWGYIRLCGSHGQFPRDDHELVDPTLRLKDWTARIRSTYGSTKPLFVSVGNSFAGYGPGTIFRWMRLLGMEPPSLPQPALF